MEFLLRLAAASDWNGENEEEAGRNLDIEGDDDTLAGNSSGALCRIIVVGGLNADTKSDAPPPPPPLLKKDPMILLCLQLQQLQ